MPKVAKGKSKPAVNITEGNIQAMLQKSAELDAAASLELKNFFNDGIKKSGSAARKYLQEKRKLAQELRQMIQAKKQADKE